MAAYPAKTKRSEVLVSFIESLNTNKNVLVTAEEVFDTMSVCFAAEEANKGGQIVNIEYL